MKLTFGKDKLESKPLSNPPAGIYEFMLEGFKPKWGKEKTDGSVRGVNLRPILKIVNHPTLTGAEIFTWCSTNMPSELYDLSHALGVPFENEGQESMSVQGEFQGPDDDPTQWTYVGPLVGQVGKLEIGERTNNKTGKPETSLKRYFCRVEGCQADHRESYL